jgi:FtsP/CotA-like multicopper oxidase with cupredoxin domain
VSNDEQKEGPAMRAFAPKKARALLVLVMATAGLTLTSSTASAAAETINLCATSGTVTMPGGVVVPIWGFADGGPGATPVCTAGTASLPGPVLDVNQGDVVTINVTNVDLTAANTVRFEIPGVPFDPGPTDAAVGLTVTRTFAASAPGTYLYQSGGNAGRQTAMGLYGALLVRPTSAPDTPIPGQAYGDPATAYDVEATLVLSAVDPAFNAAPDTFDLNNYLATYWLINGEAYPDTDAVPAAVGDRVLLRYLNAGFDNSTMSLLGAHERVVARDARLLNNPFLANAETIPAGATEDAIVTVPSTPPPSANGFPLYNRQLHVTNGTLVTPNPNHSPGGMLTFIDVIP